MKKIRRYYSLSIIIIILLLMYKTSFSGNAVVVVPLGSSPNQVPTVTSEGQTWMDRNLGAIRPATKEDDPDSYGHLFQWGRNCDGHEDRTSGIITTLSPNPTPGHNSFILAETSPNDWISSQSNALWQDVSGTNNPCPSGFRLPTRTEVEAEMASWSSSDAAGAFSSPLKLPLAGYRIGTNHLGQIVATDIFGHIWTSTYDYSPSLSGYKSFSLHYHNLSGGGANIQFEERAHGHSVRCIKD